jgi:hypothetical protein
VCVGMNSYQHDVYSHGRSTKQALYSSGFSD